MVQRVSAAWRGWMTPIHSDPDEAFRERTLRLAVPLFVLASILQTVLILLTPDIQSSRVIALLSYAVWALIAGLCIHRGRLTVAASLLALVFIVSLAISQTRQGYWSGYMFFVMAIGLMFGQLVFPRRLGVLFGAILIIEFTLIAFWQEHAEVPYPNPLHEGDALRSPLFAAIGTTAFVSGIIGLTYYYGNEFNHRARRVKELVNTLEDRVAERTAELNAANQQLTHLAGIKDEFVSNVTHELRTPITNLKLRYHLLAQQPDQLDQHLSVIERETERLSHIIESLLTLSRIDQNRISLEWTDIDLNTLAQQYVDDRASLAQRYALTLRAEGQPGVPRVGGDRALLGQALSILLTNALNYTPAGGTVVVKVGMRQVDGTTWGELAVIDNGPGITPDEQTRLFERFFRGAAAQASHVPGTGLGLAILKEIVDWHTGRVEVHSTGIPGDGTHFYILLRAAAAYPPN